MNADPKTMAKYWIHYRIDYGKDLEKSKEGGMGMYLPRPITDPKEIITDVSQAVAQQCGIDLKLPVGMPCRVEIFSFQRIEELIQIARTVQ